MATHILPLTYKPKIAAVKAGTCTQTIRHYNPLRPKRVGDKLILHTWADKPYYSKWDWRLETIITYRKRLEVQHYGMFNNAWYQWTGWEGGEFVHNANDEFMDDLAARDGIDPPTREGLEATLMALNKLKTLEGTQWEVIRW